jgi:hypothetical protein
MALTDISRYCEFYQLQGRRAVQTASTVWVEVRRNVFQQSPAFNMQRNLADEAAQMLSQTRALAARWFTPAPEIIGHHETNLHTPVYLLRPPYDLNCLRANARNQTRQGLKRVEVRRTAFDIALEPHAYEVYADNTQRLGLFRSVREMRQRWAQWVETLSACACTEFWGAWEGGRLVAFCVVVFGPWGAEIVLQRSLGQSLQLNPNNALIFTIANSVFDRDEAVLSFGLGEFGANRGGLDHFKTGMAFKVIELQNNFTWHTRLRLFKHVLTPARLKWLARHLRNPESFWGRFSSSLSSKRLQIGGRTGLVQHVPVVNASPVREIHG